ncbi:MAG TPA: fatty acyl-AMP ligase [Thermoanaerobaculia bacterium]|jgi:acyl-CoA synthetase (AMP-forming)/AMP-acid ligase II|nr:fatty acyl-AMP ligase [Thermoanaerobaculia bacterium]
MIGAPSRVADRTEIGARAKTTRPAVEPGNLADILRLPAATDPEGVALHFIHHGAPRESLTWRELWRRAGTEAARLRDAGVGAGDRVMLVLPSPPDFVAAFFGAARLGAVPVPVAPLAPRNSAARAVQSDRLSAVAADCHAAAVIAQPEVCESLNRRSARDRKRIWLAPAAPGTPPAEVPPDVARDPDGLALLQYTSGSTSRPKGVELSHRSILANVAAIVERIDHPDAVGLTWLPLHHDMGLIGGLLSPLAGRMTLYLMPPRAFLLSPLRWLSAISEHRVTMTVAPNFAFAYCLENIDPADLEGVRLDSLRIALNGAEPVDPAVVARFEEKFRPYGLRSGVVTPVYGLAENCLAVTFSDFGAFRLDAVDADRLELTGRALPADPANPVDTATRRRTFVSVGRPIGHQEVRIAGRGGKPLPERQVGEILVRGPSVMRAYHRRAQATARALRGGWLHTGDLGYLADGQLFVTGRKKELIIRNGRNYHPQDLESQLRDLPGLRAGSAVAFAVEARPALRVVVVAETREKEPQARALLAREIRGRIHDACLFGPDEVILVRPGTIPRTTSGKPRRPECRRMYLAAELGGGAVE